MRPDRKDEPVRRGRLACVRQWIEAVFGTLKGRLGPEQHGGRTPAGVFARTGRRLRDLAAGIWHDWTTGAKIKRSLIAYDRLGHRTHSSSRAWACLGTARPVCGSRDGRGGAAIRGLDLAGPGSRPCGGLRAVRPGHATGERSGATGADEAGCSAQTIFPVGVKRVPHRSAT